MTSGPLLRPLLDIRIHLVVAALPLFELLVFRDMMMGSFMNPPVWPTLADFVLRWGAHEVLFTLSLFLVVGFAVPGGALRFVRGSLIVLGVIAIARAALYMPMMPGVLDSDPVDFERLQFMVSVRRFAMFAVDPLLAGCMVFAVARTVRRAGGTPPSLGALGWPALVLAVLVSVSSALRFVATRSTPGGPFGFDIWMIDGIAWPGGRELLWTILGAWVTALPVLLLGRWTFLARDQGSGVETATGGVPEARPGDP